MINQFEKAKLAVSSSLRKLSTITSKKPPGPPPQLCGAQNCTRPGCIISPLPSLPIPILDLPLEIQLLIFSHLTFWDRQALRHTSHHFHDLIPPPTHDELLDAERAWAGYLHFHHYVPQPRNLVYACAGCLRLRPDEKFDTGRGNKWEKTDVYGLLRHCRFCIDCRDEAMKAEETEKWGIGMIWNRWYRRDMDIFWCGRCERTGIRPWPQVEPEDACLRCLTVDWEDEEVRRREMRALELRRVKRREHLERLKERWRAHVIARNQAREHWEEWGKVLSVFDATWWEDREPVDGLELDLEEDRFNLNDPRQKDVFRFKTDFSGMDILSGNH